MTSVDAVVVTFNDSDDDSDDHNCDDNDDDDNQQKKSCPNTIKGWKNDLVHMVQREDKINTRAHCIIILLVSSYSNYD